MRYTARCRGLLSRSLSEFMTILALPDAESGGSRRPLEMAALGHLGPWWAFGTYRIADRDSTREDFDRLVQAAKP